MSQRQTFLLKILKKMPQYFITELFMNNIFRKSNIITIILTMLIKICTGSYTYLETGYPTMNGIASDVHSLDGILTNQFVLINTNSTAYQMIITNINATQTTFGYVTKNVTLPSNTTTSTFIRTTQGNGINGQGTFLLGSSLNLVLYTNYFNSSITILNLTAGSISIVDAFFVANSTTDTVVLLAHSGSSYTVRYYTSTTMVKQVTLGASSSNVFYRFVKYSTYAYFQFDSILIVLSINSSLTQVNSISMPSSGTVYHMDAYGNYLVYAYSSNVVVMKCANASSAVKMYTIKTPSSVDDVRVRYPYIIIATNNVVQQYDIDLMGTISLWSNTTTIGWNLAVFDNGIIYMYKSGVQNFRNFTIFRIDGNIPALSGGTCYKGYVITQTGTCTKNMTMFLPVVTNTTTNVTTNTTANTTANTTTNTTANTTTNTTTNTTANTTTNVTTNTTTNTTANTTTTILSPLNTTTTIPSPSPSPPSPSIIFNDSSIYPYPQYKQQSTKNSIFDDLCRGIGKALTFSTVRILPRIMMCFSFFLDDLWFYRFHRFNYTQSAAFFMNKIDIINALRLNPWFIREISYLNSITIAENDSQIYNLLFSSDSHNPDSIYFLNASSDIIINGFITTILFFIATKLIQYLLYYLKKSCKIFKSIYILIRYNARWWTLITALLEVNITRLVFNSALQFLIFGSYNYSNKINFICCVSGLFFVLFYCCNFYPLVYQYQRSKKSAETLLTHSKYSFNSYYMETCCFLIRNFTRSFIQGIVIQSYSWQIISLGVSNLLIILLCLKFRKQFLNKIVFLLVFFYHIILAILDLCFLLNFKYTTIFDILNYDQLIFVLICCLIAALFLFSLCTTIDNFVIFCKQKNREIQESTTNFMWENRFNFGFNAKIVFKEKLSKDIVEKKAMDIQMQRTNKKQKISNIFDKKTLGKFSTKPTTFNNLIVRKTLRNKLQQKQQINQVMSQPSQMLIPAQICTLRTEKSN